MYVDDLSYAGTHGHAYCSYGIDDHHGAVVVVRPDQRKSCAVLSSNKRNVRIAKVVIMFNSSWGSSRTEKWEAMRVGKDRGNRRLDVCGKHGDWR